jgi:hypothetical protein
MKGEEDERVCSTAKVKGASPGIGKITKTVSYGRRQRRGFK